jgi:calcineurin-like phosphoesterase family protein
MRFNAQCCGMSERYVPLALRPRQSQCCERPLRRSGAIPTDQVPTLTVFFTSDHHFGHGGARGLFRRPFATTAAMDAAMVARWNEAVAPGDEVWHLGDFAVRQSPARIGELLDALSGTKHLIVGNNDGPATAGLTQWASVQQYTELQMDGIWLILCHYPLRTWNRIGRGALNLHGHSHGRLAPLPRQVDVGVDCWDYRPITLAHIRAHLGRGAARAGGPTS